jgi:hypothetical protein
VSEQAEYTYDVFISYSHPDHAWVWDELLPRLEGAAPRVCIDDRDFEIAVHSLVKWSGFWTKAGAGRSCRES